MKIKKKFRVKLSFSFLYRKQMAIIFEDDHSHLHLVSAIVKPASPCQGRARFFLFFARFYFRRQ